MSPISKISPYVYENIKKSKKIQNLKHFQPHAFLVRDTQPVVIKTITFIRKNTIEEKLRLYYIKSGLGMRLWRGPGFK